MHIGFLTPEYPHEDFTRSGGLGTSIKNLAAALVQQGVTVTVFVTGQRQDKALQDQGVRLVGITKKKNLAFNWYLERKRLQRRIQKEIDLQGIQLIEAPDWTGLSAFMTFTVPLVIRMHGSDGYFCHLEGRQQKWKHRFLEGKAMQNADALLAASTFTGEETKALFGLKQDITTIYNGIDVASFTPDHSQIQDCQILYFGTLVRKKGVLELPFIFNRIVEQLPAANLVLIGKDNIDVLTQQSTWSLFQNALSPNAKAQVKHLVEVPYEIIKTYIAQAQVVVLPSFAEAFPMTWLETLAMEKPLVSSNIGWAKELMVDGETGFTVNPRDHEAYALTIVELLKDKNKGLELGKTGRKRIEDLFSTHRTAQKSIAFYKKIIKDYDGI
ncbi:glycosyltransferase family 4 protein [Formosa sp. S-31]|uniref:glycosyltransferase family 4 protein n=1 Tax=Formosa sp. S-31 TaxID=2790949 RepID=UPI003EBE322A